MKKLLTVLLLTASATAFAQHHGHGWRHHGHHNGPGWGYFLAPIVIGGVVGAAVANNNRRTETVIVEQQPVIVQPLQQNCTAWKEVLSPEGKIYRERTCYGLQ
jgi:hypothetical protein